MIMSDLSIQAKQKLHELKREYLKSFPEKSEEIKSYWIKKDLSELRIQCHKLAGSAASFEFPDVSFAAKTLEALCKTRLKNKRANSILLEDDKTLVDAYKVLMDTFNKYNK